MKTITSIFILTLATWAGSAAALHPGALCSELVPEAYSFKIDIPEVPAFYDSEFRHLILSRVWRRLHNAYVEDHRGFKNRLSLIFDDHYFAVLDPRANPQRLRAATSPHAGADRDDRALLFVFDGIDRVAATHPYHRLARRVLAQMVTDGELTGFTESSQLTTAVRAVWGCQ